MTNQPNQPQGMPDVIHANNPFDRKDIGVWDTTSEITTAKYIRFDKHQEALNALKELTKLVKPRSSVVHNDACSIGNNTGCICGITNAIQTAERILKV